MKKIAFSSLVLYFCVAVSFAFATPDKEKVGRQCCSKQILDFDTGITYTVTACAGWFLSDDDKALERACDKLD
jgi:hypothetical protein